MQFGAVGTGNEGGSPHHFDTAFASSTLARSTKRGLHVPVHITYHWFRPGEFIKYVSSPDEKANLAIAACGQPIHISSGFHQQAHLESRQVKHLGYVREKIWHTGFNCDECNRIWNELSGRPSQLQRYIDFFRVTDRLGAMRMVQAQELVTHRGVDIRAFLMRGLTPQDLYEPNDYRVDVW